MKLNKKQTKIYDWLVSKPGYLKKGQEASRLIFYKSQLDNPFDYDSDDFNKAFNACKELHRSSLDLSFSPNKKQNILIGDKIVKRSFKEVFPWLESTKAVIHKSPSVVRNEAIAKDIVSNLSRVQKTITKERNTPGTYWITGCAHAPWQNKSMYDSTINFLSKEVELTGIILAGDIIDNNSLSSHDRGRMPMPGVTLGWEYDEANKFLDLIDELKVYGTKDFIYGNHEDRFLRHLGAVDAAKTKGALISPEIGLKLKDRHYNVYTDWKNDSISLGKHLDVNHGEFFNIHTAKKTIDTYKKSTLYFHTHRFQIYIEGLVGGFNMGFGADINSPIFNFASRSMKKSWINSSALVTLDNDGFYHVEPLMFINGKLIIAGKTY